MSFCSEYGSILLDTCFIGNWSYILGAWSVAAVLGVVGSLIINLLKR